MRSGQVVSKTAFSTTAGANHEAEAQYKSQTRRVIVLFICFVTETKLTKKTDHINIVNYNCYRNDKDAINPGGGVAIFINKRLNSLVTTCDVDYSKIKNTEALAIMIGDIMFIAVYKPPQIDLNYDDFEILYNLHDQIIIGGDINARHPAWGDTNINKTGKALINNVITNKFKFNIHHSDEPTYYSPITMRGSNFDLFFTRKIKIKKPHTINELSSDHLPLVTRISSMTVYNNNTCKPLDYSKTDWNAYKSELNRNWSISKEFSSKNEVDETITKLNHAMQAALQQATPVCFKSDHKYPCNSEINKIIKLRNKTRKLYQKHRCKICKKLVNRLNKQIKYLMNEDKNSRIANAMKNLRVSNGSLWNAVIMSKWRQNKTKKIRKIHSQNGIIFDKKEIVESFADTFEKIHHTTSKFGTTKTNNLVKHNFNAIRVDNTSNINIQIHTHEIKILISKLKNKKAPGLDKISNLQLKNSTNKIITQLYYIYDYCIKNMCFPKIWRLAKILPIPKPGKNHLFPQNYRPISLLSTTSKIFESLIAKRIRKYLDNNNCFNEAQYGFRPGLCTVRQLSGVLYTIIANKNKNKFSSVLLLDIEKAFDTVCHRSLIYKMTKTGLPTNIICLIKSYITAREFVVFHDGVLSESRDIVAGVPQGSVLGPLLFLIFINDISEYHDNTLALFADDTAVIANSGSLKLLKHKTSNHFDMINKYFYDWKIKINQQKTELLVVKHTKFNTKISIEYNGQLINELNSVKYLGIVIDAKLKFNKHVTIQLQPKLRRL